MNVMKNESCKLKRCSEVTSFVSVYFPNSSAGVIVFECNNELSAGEAFDS